MFRDEREREEGKKKRNIRKISICTYFSRTGEMKARPSGKTLIRKIWSLP